MAVASNPLAAPNTSLQGLVLTKRLQSWVHEAEQPESTVAKINGREEMMSEVALSPTNEVMLSQGNFWLTKEVL